MPILSLMVSAIASVTAGRPPVRGGLVVDYSNSMTSPLPHISILFI
ncbi:hypothetical protein BSD967_10620 [Bifidobacterium saguini]|uniref:Uncharacterized protein n=1 Tax=Bifidobacterium saguini TaxID=762210 RepID=A0ABX7SBM5_9BIFI|nr:hypothetical protein [Bifidobacterium saguini]QTB90726.1 hypothetical protein BSD967_10620 [Bifidobacterium saguini]